MVAHVCIRQRKSRTLRLRYSERIDLIYWDLPEIMILISPKTLESDSKSLNPTLGNHENRPYSCEGLGGPFCAPPPAYESGGLHGGKEGGAAVRVQSFTQRIYFATRHPPPNETHYSRLDFLTLWRAPCPASSHAALPSTFTPRARIILASGAVCAA